ncbi:bifunctional aspartate kinase/homoserine dehydrogenase II [Pseudoalteromonas tunicata]|uniref:bifunctional aspartate kinase/homoserine dehydrogenase II n=1 Tax=Pseudoalteromonas tunicata TaxID=314281 RepID=UPI00273E8FC0|nr:bifunctional aspartate kinase/homoserine dehydrogenase II [Pseudoalteromonas tunicata]MDP4985260.1 bifunctional aspartate kinase/homoserine dehydrogenase II [Pseudoalteromonas tunicata]MDP5213309.1 bifunctional aspartate kinase/homoserine dehydrogenase II [Pseudoalteromonas tunicata]
MTRSVHKFGGSSLSSAKRYHAVANIILQQAALGDVVVVSAAGKTTDTLVKLWQSYRQADQQAISDVLALLSANQFELIADLLTDSYKDSALELLDAELISIGEKIASQHLQEAHLLAHGELWSARLLGLYLQQLNVAAQSFDARELLTLAQGVLQHEKNVIACGQFSATKYNVVTGFIASDEQGQTITLGRNGSDYSATLFARYICAESVSIWTDTQGVFSTDPRKVKQAIRYGKICRGQANLLARLGNPVLHAKTLTPLKDTDIKLVVRSSFDSSSAATEIVKEGFAKQKRFITNLDHYDLLKVADLHEGEVGELSRIVQHALHHFVEKDEVYLLVPAALGHQVLTLLAGRCNLVESNVSGIALVCQHGDGHQLAQSAKVILAENNVNLRFIYSHEDYCILLCEQQLDTDRLTILHDKLVSVSQELAVVVAGLGNVGTVFLEQLKEQLSRLNQLLPVKLVGLIRSEQMLFNPTGIDVQNWQAAWQTHAVSYHEAELLSHLAELDYEHKLVIDITASEQFSQLYPQFVAHNCHLICANKYAGTAPLAWYEQLQQSLKQRNLQWRYNTSVGAGLPINFALNDLQNSGDKVQRLSGVFSGTLSWLCSQYTAEVPFSELVMQAKAMGYSEPDPREDLSGRDVQRKLLILARELGLNLELDDIVLSPLMPEALSNGDWEFFVDNLALLDTYVSELAAKAALEDKVLRYVAELVLSDDKVTAQVGLQGVAKQDSLATLKPGDNIFVINSRWYQDNPLVIQGPGAGKEVTAAGVHSDLYWLCVSLAK